MSDQPNGPELVELGVEVDNSGFGQFLSQLDGVQASLNQINESIANAGGVDAFQAKIDELTTSGSSLAEAADAATVAFQSQAEAITNATVQLGNADERLQQYMADVQQMAALPPTAMGPTGEDFGGGGEGVGSLYGVARGFRAGAGIGRIAGAGPETTMAFTGVADILYLQQGFEKLSAVLPNIIEGVGETITKVIAAAAEFPVLSLALIAVTAAVGALIAVDAEYEASLKAQKDAIQAKLDADENYAKDSQNLTTDQAQTKLNKLKSDQDAEQKVVTDNLQHIRDNIIQSFPALNIKPEDVAALSDKDILAGKGPQGADLRGSDFLTQFYTKIDEAGKKAEAATPLIDNYTNGIAKGEFILNDAAAAAIKKADADTKQTQQFAADDQLTMAAAQQKLTALEQDHAKQLQAASDLQRFAEANDLSGEALQKNKDAVQQHLLAAQDDTDNINHINEISLGLIQTRKDEADAVKAADDQNKKLEASLKTVTDAQIAYDKAIQTARDNAITGIANATTQERTAEQQYTEGSIQDTFKRQTIATEAERQRAALELDTSNKITDVRTKTGQDEAKIVLDYNRQIFDDQIKYQQDIQKAQTAANNTAVNDLQNHVAKLSQITRDAHQSEMDDIANRDFQKLAKDMQTEQNKTSDENTSYAQRESALQTHLQQQENDILTNLANTEAQQKRNEERKAADAQTKADQEIEKLNTDEKRKQDTINTSEQQKLNDLTRSEQEQIAVLRQGLVQRITLIQIEENQREQIAAQTDAAIVAAHNAAMSQLHATANDFSNQLNQLNQTTTVHGALGTQINTTYAGSTPATPVISQPVQQAQQGFDVSSIIGAIANGVQGFFNL